MFKPLSEPLYWEGEACAQLGVSENSYTLHSLT
jgi:hypothetical protein